MVIMDTSVHVPLILGVQIVNVSILEFTRSRLLYGLIDPLQAHLFEKCVVKVLVLKVPNFD